MAKTHFDYDPVKIVPQDLWDMDQIMTDPLHVRVREEEKKGTGVFCPQDPSGASRKRLPSPFPGRGVVRREIYYTSHIFRGAPVRIAAHVAIPSSDGPLPAMIHAAGSIDSAENFALAHNVVAIAIDRPGVGDSNGPPDSYNEAWLDLVHDPRDGWMWQFITSAMRAITYAQTLPEVDPERIGVTGGSRGGTM